MEAFFQVGFVVFSVTSALTRQLRVAGRDQFDFPGKTAPLPLIVDLYHLVIRSIVMFALGLEVFIVAEVERIVSLALSGAGLRP